MPLPKNGSTPTGTLLLPPRSKVAPERERASSGASGPRTHLRRQGASVALGLLLAGSGCIDPLSISAPPSLSPFKASPTVRYQSHPRLFVPSLRVGALAALPDRLLATTVGPGQEKLVAIDAEGRVQPLGVRFEAAPEAVCPLALSPGHHPAFPEGDLLVGSGPNIQRVHLALGDTELLASLPAEEGDVVGLCFDSQGSFAYDPLVLAQNGGVYRLEANGQLWRVGNVGAGGSGPSIASPYFGPYAGHLLVAFQSTGDVIALSPVGKTSRLTGWSGVTAALAFPEVPRVLDGTDGAFFFAVRSGTTSQVYYCTAADIAPHNGAMLLTSLHASGDGLARLESGRVAVESWSRFLGAEVAAAFVQRPALTRLALDVRPGGADDIACGSAELVPVALLSSSYLSAALIDASTVTFAGAAVVPSRKGGLGTYTDCNADGAVDLVVTFRPAEMHIAPGPATLVLEGSTFGSERLRGEARVQVIAP